MEKKYDIVIIVSVLEHVTDPINFLKNLKLLLKNKGKVIIECPSINDPLIKFYDVQEYKNFYYRPVHLNYFNRKHLIKIVKKSRFKLIKTFSILVYSLLIICNGCIQIKDLKVQTQLQILNYPLKKSIII